MAKVINLQSYKDYKDGLITREDMLAGKEYFSEFWYTCGSCEVSFWAGRYAEHYECPACGEYGRIRRGL
jgi:hypothetical protein